MDAHGWLTTSHRTLWWCGGCVVTYPGVPRHNALGNDMHFNFKTNIQNLIVPRSNNNESHRKKKSWATETRMAKMTWWSGIFSSRSLDITPQKYCGDVIPQAYCTHVWHGCVITSNIILVNRASLFSDSARGAHPVMKRWLVLDCRKLCDTNGLPLWCHMMITSEWDLDYFPLYSCGCLGC